MGAVWTRARSDLRRHIRSAIAISVLIGMTSMVALTAAAGAHRTDTAYERFRAAFNSPDVTIFSCASPLDVLAPTVDFTEVARLPEVEAVRVAALWAGEAIGADGEPLFFGQPNADTNFLGASTTDGEAVVQSKILEGRLPDPTRIDEVAVGYAKKLDPQAAVGSTIDLRLPKPNLTGRDLMAGNADPEAILEPPIRVKVVGRAVIANGVELGGTTYEIYVTPAFVQRYLPDPSSCEMGLVTLKNGQADYPTFEKALSAATPGANIVPQEDEATLVRRSVEVQVATLWLFALLATLAGFMVFGQALSRLSFAESTENPILSALGMTRRQLFAIAMVRAAVIGTAAAAVALAGSVAASSLFPTGPTRNIEPTPGVDFNPIVLGGALCVLLGVLLLSVIPALRGARAQGDAQGLSVVEELRRPSVTAGLVSRSSLPVSAATGVRLALEPGRGRTSVPVRSAIIGLAMAVAALTAAAGFSASFQHLKETPRLWGFFGDIGGGLPFVGGFDDAIAAMVDDPGLSDVVAGNFREQVYVQGPGETVRANVWGMDTLKGSLTPVMAEGSWPVNDGELALGDVTMRQLGVGIGDTVKVSSTDATVELKVVGKTIFGDFGFGPGLGRGVGMTFPQLQALFPDLERNLFSANIAPGASADDVQGRLNPLFAPLGAPLGTTQELKDQGMVGVTITSLGGAQQVPLALSGLLVFAALATLVHVLVTSIRRRRRDLAILKTLGFVRRQVSATVAWQATTLASIALLIGLPLGAAVGRWIWTLFANRIGVIPEPVVDLPPLLLAIPVTLFFANLIALVPGRLAARTRPAAALRSE